MNKPLAQDIGAYFPLNPYSFMFATFKGLPIKASKQQNRSYNHDKTYRHTAIKSI